MRKNLISYMRSQTLCLTTRQRSTIQVTGISEHHIGSIGRRKTKQASFIRMYRNSQSCNKYHKTNFLFHNSKT